MRGATRAPVRAGAPTGSPVRPPAGGLVACLAGAVLLCGCAVPGMRGPGPADAASGAPGSPDPGLATGAIGNGAPDADEPDVDEPDAVERDVDASGIGEEDPGVLGAVGRIVDGAQRSASDRFDAFMLDLDGFFAGDVESEESNDSFVRLRIDAIRPAVGSFELDPSVKLRVVLPRAEQRVRFLFSTEEDPGTAGERIGEGIEINDQTDQRSVSFALRFVRGAREKGDTSIDLGARQRDGRLQIFTRVQLRLDERLGERWTLRATDRWYYYYLSGYENQLRLDFTRPIDSGGARFVRATTTFDWERERKGASIGQTIGAYADLSSRTALAAELLARYDTSVARGAEDRYRGTEARLRLRRNVWRPWFFYELWPSVSWPAETDYRRVWHWLARVEVNIGGRYREFPEGGSDP